jgi:hypothetical protein
MTKLPGLLRRDLMATAAGATVAVAAPAANKLTLPPRITSDQDLEAALPALSNWNRWGPDDQLDTLNFISPRTRLLAIPGFQRYESSAVFDGPARTRAQAAFTSPTPRERSARDSAPDEGT